LHALEVRIGERFLSLTGEPLLSSREAGPILDELYRLAARLRDQPESGDILARVYEHIGTVLHLTGSRAEALVAWEAAEAAWGATLRIHPDIPRAWAGAARLAYKLASLRPESTPSDEARVRLRQALAQWRRSLERYEERLRIQPGERVLRGDLLLNHSELAWHLAKIGLKAKAIDHYRRARAIQEGLVQDGPHEAGDRDRLAYLGMALGYLLKQTGQAAEAAREFDRSQGLLKPLARERPTDIDLRKRLARAYVASGMAWRQAGRAAEALRGFQRGGALWDELDCEGRSRYLKERSQAHYLLGAVQDALHQPVEALRSYRRAADLYEELVRESPTDARARQGLAASLDNIGNLEDDHGRHDAAVVVYRRALSILEALCREAPENRDYRRDLAGTSRNLAEAIEQGRRQGKRGASHPAVADQAVAESLSRGPGEQEMD
jgi:tetratricopeptide (TPR) repeat protein